MFSSEGLTEEVFIFTLIQVAARTHFLWPEDSGPGFLLTMGWRLPSGCGGHLQFLEATHSALSRGLSNLVMHFIKPLCSAWWWNLIQFNTVTGVILTETIHYLSHILWIETNHKSHFYTNGWDYTKMCVYRVCLHLFYIWWQLLSLTPSSFLSASYLGKPIRKPAYSLTWHWQEVQIIQASGHAQEPSLPASPLKLRKNLKPFQTFLGATVASLESLIMCIINIFILSWAVCGVISLDVWIKFQADVHFHSVWGL